MPHNSVYVLRRTRVKEGGVQGVCPDNNKHLTLNNHCQHRHARDVTLLRHQKAYHIRVGFLYIFMLISHIFSTGAKVRVSFIVYGVQKRGSIYVHL